MAAAYHYPHENAREGSDIRASDMVTPEEDSDIKNFYKGSVVLITGATGYLGKLAMEKLLRTCDVNKIYIMIRSKKGKDPQKRFEEIFDEPIFDPIKRKNPEVLRKVHIMGGDASLPKLGLTDEDIETLQSEVDIILHFAATVRFDEKIKHAVHINVGAVKELIAIAKKMKNLRSFLHVSTAYSNCVQTTIEEKFYEPPIPADKIMTLVNCLDDDKLDAITPTLLGDYPNTYAFTKCIAESLLRTEGKNLPIGLYRPSIVIGTAKEPVSGWINNIYGPTGVLLGVAIGLLRCLHGKSSNYADMVPADYVVNSALASAWDVATIKTINENKEVQDEQSREEKYDKEIPVYNFVSTPERPLTWQQFQDYTTKHCLTIPSEKCIWYNSFRMIETPWICAIMTLLLHTIPAYIVDFLAVCIGKKPMLVKVYQKINKFSKILCFFCIKEWKFVNDNTKSLYERLKPSDKELFEFSMEKLNWDLFFYTYCRGVRVYVLKDPLDTIPQGKKHYRKLYIAHMTTIVVVSALFLKLALFILGFIF